VSFGLDPSLAGALSAKHATSKKEFKLYVGTWDDPLILLQIPASSFKRTIHPSIYLCRLRLARQLRDHLFSAVADLHVGLPISPLGRVAYSPILTEYWMQRLKVQGTIYSH